MDGLIRESRLTTPITSLPGIGAQKTSLFARLGIFSLQDLIEFYPRAYKDTVRFYPFMQIAALNEAAAGVAETIAVEKTPTKNGMLTVITAIDEDALQSRLSCGGLPRRSEILFLRQNSTGKRPFNGTADRF